MDFATVAVEPDISEAQRQEESMNLGFIKRGYRKWMERAILEELRMENQDFLDVLVPGLQRLEHLDSVDVNGGRRRFHVFEDHRPTASEVPKPRTGS